MEKMSLLNYSLLKNFRLVWNDIKYIILNYKKSYIEYEIKIWPNITKYIKVSEFPECCICYEKSNLISFCKHDFCEVCINELFKSNKFLCALCRSELKEKPFIKLIE